MNDTSPYVDFIKNRRSVRNYHQKAISLDLIDSILETARWAPSAHNSQPWRFFVLTKESVRENLIKKMARRFYHDLVKDGVTKEFALTRCEASIERLSKSPAIILACIDTSKVKYYPDSLRKKAEEILASQSLAAALQNMLLTATSFGLGGCWFSAPLFCQEAVKKVVGLPEDYIPQALVTLGYPIENPDPPPRLSLNEIRKII
jgi:F420 biosynthesis protein FbiB-like protein